MRKHDFRSFEAPPEKVEKVKEKRNYDFKFKVRKYGIFVTKLKDKWRIHYKWMYYATAKTLPKVILLAVLKVISNKLDDYTGYNYK